MELNIRPCGKADLPALAAIHDPARRNELALAGLSAAFLPLEVAAEREGLFDYAVYLAEAAGTPVGFVAYCAEELAWLYVDVNHTREGVGSALVAFALQHIRRDADIEVLAGNSPALALYARFGFETEKLVHGVMPGNEQFPVTVHVLRRKARRP